MMETVTVSFVARLPGTNPADSRDKTVQAITDLKQGINRHKVLSCFLRAPLGLVVVDSGVQQVRA